jgi:putative hydrolase of HD superfamily
MLDKEVYGLLPESWHADFRMYAEHEFENFVTEDGKVRIAAAAEIHEKYNEDAFNPKDGELVKRADQLAAFVEAYAGIRNGSISQDLQFAKGNIYRQEQEAQYLGLNSGDLLRFRLKGAAPHGRTGEAAEARIAPERTR